MKPFKINNPTRIKATPPADLVILPAGLAKKLKTAVMVFLLCSHD